MASGKAQAGFTLIEVLVAFAILSMALGGLYHVFATDLDVVGRTENRGRALLVAQSVMAGVGADTPLEAGRYKGSGAHEVTWKIEISPYVDEQSDAPEGAKVNLNALLKTQLMLVEVTIDVGGAPLVLRSIRLAEVGAAR